MNDEAQGELLDTEFRQILFIIKPLINDIDDRYRLERYRVWLERLSAVHHAEKLERNKYLLALANQIHDGVLEPPFTINPPKGFLPPLKKLKMLVTTEDPSCLSEHLFQETREWPYVTSRRSETNEHSVKPQSPKDQKKIVKVGSKVGSPFRKIGKAASTGQESLRNPDSSWYDVSDTTQGDTDVEEGKKKLSVQHKEEGLKLQEHFMKKYEDEVRNSSKESVSMEERINCYKYKKRQIIVAKCDDDKAKVRSKIPLVESKQAQEQKVKRKSKEVLPREVKQRHHDEGARKRHETRVQTTSAEERDSKPVQDRHEKKQVQSVEPLEEQSSRATEQELEALKMRMRDLLEVKYALRDTHCLTEDRKKTVDALHAKVARLEEENAKLQALLDSQQKKLSELDQAKNEELNSLKEKFARMRETEVEYLKQHHKNEIIALETSHSMKTAELEIEIANLQKDYEDRIKTVTDSSVNLVKLKDDEIQQLQTQLKIRASQLANEGNGEQIINLKRCISKLDKVLHKNEKDYVKKIERLKQELEVKDMTNQMQLQTQRADLIVRHAATKQEELKNALNSLEGKYKKMMETLQTRALVTKKQDEQLIEELRTLLDHNSITYLV